MTSDEEAKWRGVYRMPSNYLEDSLEYNGYTKKYEVDIGKTQDYIEGCYLLFSIFFFTFLPAKFLIFFSFIFIILFPFIYSNIVLISFSSIFIFILILLKTLINLFFVKCLTF